MTLGLEKSSFSTYEQLTALEAAGRLFQTLTIRLQGKCFLMSTRLWCTNNF